MKKSFESIMCNLSDRVDNCYYIKDNGEKEYHYIRQSFLTVKYSYVTVEKVIHHSPTGKEKRLYMIHTACIYTYNKRHDRILKTAGRYQMYEDIDSFVKALKRYLKGQIDDDDNDVYFERVAGTEKWLKDEFKHLI